MKSKEDWDYQKYRNKEPKRGGVKMYSMIRTQIQDLAVIKKDRKGNFPPQYMGFMLDLCGARKGWQARVDCSGAECMEMVHAQTASYLGGAEPVSEYEKTLSQVIEIVAGYLFGEVDNQR